VGWGSFDAEQVRALYDDYAAFLDDGDYESWMSLFVDDATYVVVARENIERGLPLATIRCDSKGMLADRIDALTTTQFHVRRTTRHLITAIRPVDHVDGQLETTCNFVVVETLPDEPTRIHSAGSYSDRVVDTDRGLRFAAKTSIYDAALVQTSIIVPL
jgi:3-phenylpropionate/cinnamic acid dioxygenase small subunit